MSRYWKAYAARFREICPGVPFVLEILSYIWPREIPYLDQKMWEAFPKARAREFARFLALSKRGSKPAMPEGRPSGAPSRELEEAQEMWDLEESLRYCREILGLGRR